MAHPNHSYFLVADVGGTNTRVALCDGLQVLTHTIKRYRNADFDSLETVLARYISEEGGVIPRAACVDVAGPVRDGKARLTNRDWSMDEASVGQATGTKNVALLNDLQSQGYALDHIAHTDLLQIRQGKAAPAGAPKLVVNLGTGFNATPVYATPSGPLVAISESGHATMPVRTGQDMRLNDFVAERHGFAAIDDILSGRGLERVHAFLTNEAGVDSALSSAEIMAGCQDSSNPLCVETVHYFARLAALVMGNLALVHLPFGGIYMVGGLSSAIAPFLEAAGFNDAFRDKGRFANFMDDFSVYVLQDDYAALRGNAAYLQNTLV